jgi:hypothetical protein
VSELGVFNTAICAIVGGSPKGSKVLGHALIDPNQEFEIVLRNKTDPRIETIIGSGRLSDNKCLANTLCPPRLTAGNVKPAKAEVPTDSTKAVDAYYFYLAISGVIEKSEQSRHDLRQAINAVELFISQRGGLDTGNPDKPTTEGYLAAMRKQL